MMIKKTGLVVYPRDYLLAEGDKTGNGYDYVTGVDDAGNNVKVILKYDREELAKSYEDRDVIHTTIALLAETGRRAQRPCFAAPDNGPDKPEGILFFERLVSPDFDPKKYQEGEEVAQFKMVNGVREFVAGWVKVLAIDSQDFKPEIGIGYVELKPNRIKDDDPEKAHKEARIDELNRQKQEAQMALVNTTAGPGRDVLIDDIHRISNELDTLLKYSVSYVRVINDRIVTINDFNPRHLLDCYTAIRDELTHKGRYGGVLIRAYRNGTVVQEMCGEICARFKGFENNQVVISEARDDVSAWLRFQKGRRILEAALQKGMSIDLIPIQKINCGGTGNATYNKYDAKAGYKPLLRKMRLTYEDVYTGLPIARATVMRTTSDKKQENDLMGEVHTMSEVIGAPYLLTQKPGQMLKLYSIHRERAKQAAAAATATPDAAHPQHTHTM